MDYKRVHDLIIKRARNRSIEGYTERHHIMPKCMGGSDNMENLVRLTAKEHFLIHRLLTLIYPDNSCLSYAYWAMCGLLHNQYRKYRYIPSSRAYNEARRQASEANKKRLSEFNPWKGKKHSEKSKLLQSQSAKVRNITEENESKRRAGISKSMKGIVRTELWNKNASKAKQGNKNPMFGKTGKDNPRSIPIKRYSLEDIFIDDWSSAVEAAQNLGLNYKSINNCLRGKSNSSGGFKWKKG